MSTVVNTVTGQLKQLIKGYLSDAPLANWLLITGDIPAPRPLLQVAAVLLIANLLATARPPDTAARLRNKETGIPWIWSLDNLAGIPTCCLLVWLMILYWLEYVLINYAQYMGITMILSFLILYFRKLVIVGIHLDQWLRAGIAKMPHNSVATGQASSLCVCLGGGGPSNGVKSVSSSHNISTEEFHSLVHSS